MEVTLRIWRVFRKVNTINGQKNMCLPITISGGKYTLLFCSILSKTVASICDSMRKGLLYTHDIANMSKMLTSFLQKAAWWMATLTATC